MTSRTAYSICFYVVVAALSGCDSTATEELAFSDLNNVSLSRFGGGKLALHRKVTGSSKNWDGLVVVGGKDLLTLSGTDPYGPVISPDGETLVYWTYNSRGCCLPGSKYLHMLDVSTGEIVNWEMELPGITMYDGFALWSTDGSFVYLWPYRDYQAWEESIRMFSVVDPSSPYQEEALPQGSFTSVSQLQLSTENWLFLGWEKPAYANSVFVTNRISGDSVCILAAHTVYEPAPSRIRREYEYHAPSFSPDGHRIAVFQIESIYDGISWTGGQTRLQILDDTSGEYSLVHSYVYPRDDSNQAWDSDIYMSTVWSPDGNWVAFSEVTSVRTGIGAVSSHVFAYNPASGELVQITSEPGAVDTQISWSRW
jgi:hypothetical protein